MNREELKRKLDELGVSDKEYSLYGSLEPDRIVLYQNYSKWEVFYFSERGSREDYQFFFSEELACQYIYETIRHSLQVLKNINDSMNH